MIDAGSIIGQLYMIVCELLLLCDCKCARCARFLQLTALAAFESGQVVWRGTAPFAALPSESFLQGTSGSYCGYCNSTHMKVCKSFVLL